MICNNRESNDIDIRNFGIGEEVQIDFIVAFDLTVAFHRLFLVTMKRLYIKEGISVRRPVCPSVHWICFPAMSVLWPKIGPRYICGLLCLTGVANKSTEILDPEP